MNKQSNTKTNKVAFTILLLISSITALFMYIKIIGTWELLSETVTVPYTVDSVTSEQKYLGSEHKNFDASKLFNYATINISNEKVSALVPHNTEVGKTGFMVVAKTYIDGRAKPLADLNALYVLFFVISAAIAAGSVMALAVESGSILNVVTGGIAVLAITIYLVMTVAKTSVGDLPIGFSESLSNTVVIEQFD